MPAGADISGTQNVPFWMKPVNNLDIPIYGTFHGRRTGAYKVMEVWMNCPECEEPMIKVDHALEPWSAHAGPAKAPTSRWRCDCLGGEPRTLFVIEVEGEPPLVVWSNQRGTDENYTMFVTRMLAERKIE
jgi:hypothetical protein